MAWDVHFTFPLSPPLEKRKHLQPAFHHDSTDLRFTCGMGEKSQNIQEQKADAWLGIITTNDGQFEEILKNGGFLCRPRLREMTCRLCPHCEGTEEGKDHQCYDREIDYVILELYAFRTELSERKGLMPLCVFYRDDSALFHVIPDVGTKYDSAGNPVSTPEAREVKKRTTLWDKFPMKKTQEETYQEDLNVEMTKEIADSNPSQMKPNQNQIDKDNDFSHKLSDEIRWLADRLDQRISFRLSV